jgi:LuxR family transcriptional activator of conjugal transfer of Ti plasmids
MHRTFQRFIDHLSSAADPDTLRDAMAQAATQLELSCFAYLAVPIRRGARARLISNYPSVWTEHYVQSHYERLDPVIIRALSHSTPFEWGLDIESMTPSKLQQALFEDAAKFGIRYGYTVPIHDNRGPVAAVTFAAGEKLPKFRRSIAEHARVLQLMAMYFHAHARLKFLPELTIKGVPLSPRELECLEWASKGKSAWEIGRILSISRHTVGTYLENAKMKLGVRTTVQAVALLSASRPTASTA